MAGIRFDGVAGNRMVFDQAACRSVVYTSGTVAVLVSLNSWVGYMTLFSTNLLSGPCSWIGVDASGHNPSWYDGASPQGSGGPLINPGEPHLVVGTKAPGNVTVRLHTYRYSTGVWDHTTINTQIDGAAITTIEIGDDSSGDPLDGTEFAIGLWNLWNMTDAEVERLARGDWHKLRPTLHLQWPDNTLPVSSQDRVRGGYPSQFIGTKVGQFAAPGMFKFSPARRMSIGNR